MTKRARSSAAAFALLALLLGNVALAQQKERNRKADSVQSMTAAPASSAKDEKDDKNEGDPLFKGMKKELSFRNKCGTFLSDRLNIMFMVHLKFLNERTQYFASEFTYRDSHSL